MSAGDDSRRLGSGLAPVSGPGTLPVSGPGSAPVSGPGITPISGMGAVGSPAAQTGSKDREVDVEAMKGATTRDSMFDPHAFRDLDPFYRHLEAESSALMFGLTHGGGESVGLTHTGTQARTTEQYKEGAPFRNYHHFFVEKT